MTMQQICERTEDEEVGELKVILCKIFETDLCSLAFETNKLFAFVTRELVSRNMNRMNAALRWFHVSLFIAKQ